MSIDRTYRNHHGIDGHPVQDRAPTARKSESACPASRHGSGADRAARIEQIRAAIESGVYTVSGEAIARKVIAAHLK
jgi:anti-sigma28 factor (negative regulator of flagellin synthesis)